MSMNNSIKSIHGEFSIIKNKYEDILQKQGFLETQQLGLIKSLFEEKYFTWATSEARKNVPVYNIIYCCKTKDFLEHSAFKNTGNVWKYVMSNDILIVPININVTQDKQENHLKHLKILMCSDIWKFFEVQKPTKIIQEYNVLNLITSKNVDADVDKFISKIIIKNK